MNVTRHIWFLIIVGGALQGCPADTPQGTPDKGVDQQIPSEMRVDSKIVDGKSPDSAPCVIDWTLPDVSGNNASCVAGATDYKPNDPNDGWAACISDDDTYHPFDASISSVARVAAFEEIVKLLLVAKPDAKAFVDAKLAYTQTEGLDSRVSRREDEHYPATTTKCADMTATELQQNRDRCVGPAQMQPLLNQAFLDGAQGKDVLVNAARIEATLLWFLYVSVHKESITCTTTKKDCDSSQAYYNGGEARGGGKGFSRYVRGLSSQTHDRVWDGNLAVRCWRDLDQAVPATNTTLRDQAVAQLDRALLRGVALIVKSRVKALQTTCTEAQDALWASVQILGRVLDREATLRDTAKAKVLRDELAKTKASDANLVTISTTVQDLFSCP